MHACIGEVCTTMQEVTRIYNRTLVAVFKENRKVLKEMVQTSDKLFTEARDRKYGIVTTLRRLQECDINTGHFYVQVTDYLSEVTKALIHITRPAFEHIDNNHKGLSKEQIVDLMRVNDEVEAIFDKINDMLSSENFADLDHGARNARQALRHHRRSDQEPVAPHPRGPIGQHACQRTLPDDPQRDEDDGAPGSQPAQIAALFPRRRRTEMIPRLPAATTRALLSVRRGGLFRRAPLGKHGGGGSPHRKRRTTRKRNGPSSRMNDGPVNLQREPNGDHRVV